MKTVKVYLIADDEISGVYVVDEAITKAALFRLFKIIRGWLGKL